MDNISTSGLNQQSSQVLQLENPLNTNLTNQKILRLSAAPNSAPWGDLLRTLRILAAQLGGMRDAPN